MSTLAHKSPCAVRLTIPETPRYTFDVAQDVEKAQVDAKSYINGEQEGKDTDRDVTGSPTPAAGRRDVPQAGMSDFFRHYAKRKNFLLLLGTAGSWFVLDVAFYGLSLNNGTILEAIGYSTSNTTNVYQYLYNTAIGNLIIVLAGAVPGYWISVATIDTLGRKTIQLGGFIILTILFIVMGFAYHSLSNNALLAIYVLAQLFFNFGESLARLYMNWCRPCPCGNGQHRRHDFAEDADANAPSQAPTRPRSSSLARCFPRATDPPRTASLLRRARLVPSLARAPFPRCARAAPQRTTPTPGWTTFSRFTPSLCFSGASPRSSFPRRRARRSRSSVAKTTRPLPRSRLRAASRAMATGPGFRLRSVFKQWSDATCSAYEHWLN